VAIGRDAGGVHYRSDGIEGLKLGEAIALSILREEATLFHEEAPVVVHYEVVLVFWTQKGPFLDRGAALKMEKSQCPKPAKVTHPV
jgi:hypothetical protein